MFHTALALAGLDGLLERPIDRALTLAGALLVLDAFISHGPLRRPLLRAFKQDRQGAEAGQRFLSQLAAKMVGSLFLLAVMPLAFRALADKDLMRAGRRMLATSPTSQATVEIAAGYFLYDVALCLTKYDDNGFEFLLHAVVCCAVYCGAAAFNVLHPYGAAFLLWELSTPLMYLRWLMIKAGRGAGRGMVAVNAAFMLVFFGCRIVWGPIMTLEFWRESGAELASGSPALPPAVMWTVRWMSLALNCLNFYWLAQMVRIALRGGRPKTKAV